MRSGQALTRSPKLLLAVTIEFAIFLSRLTSTVCSWPFSPKTLAGAEGFEPPSSVLETDSLTVELTPLFSFGNFVILKFCNLKIPQICRLQNYPITKLQNLLHFFVRGVLTATAAEFLELQ